MPDQWITTSDASEISGYHPDHMRRLIRAKRIRAKKFGTVWQVSRVSLKKYLRHQDELGKKRGPKEK